MSFKSVLLARLAADAASNPTDSSQTPPAPPDQQTTPRRQLFCKSDRPNIDATYATIPPFYQPLPRATDHIGQKLREEARTLFLQKRSRELLDNTELKALWSVLDAAHTQLQRAAATTTTAATKDANHPAPPPPPPLPNAAKYITYDAYIGVRAAAAEKCRRYLTAAVFARLQQQTAANMAAAAATVPTIGCQVSILALFNYVMRKVWLQQTRIGLSLYDYTGQGYLREPNLEAYILELIPTLPQLECLERSFHSFYVCTAVRKFIFFLDPLGMGCVRIRDILACSFLDDLLELREDGETTDNKSVATMTTRPHDNGPLGGGTDINWFSAPSALSVYGHYLNLDRDHNGMLSRAELAGYGSGTLTDVFLERVFAECHTYNGEMDYKTYLDLVLALENRAEPQSQHYLFRILDLEHCGYLTGFSLAYFFKGIEAQIAAHRAERVNFDDVKDEIFDMVKPEDPTRITLADLLRSGQGETVISILIEFHKFWAYENREVIVLDANNATPPTVGGDLAAGGDGSTTTPADATVAPASRPPEEAATELALAE